MGKTAIFVILLGLVLMSPNLPLAFAQTPETIQTFETGPVGQIRWSPDSEYLAVVNKDLTSPRNGRSISILDTDGRLIKTFGGEHDSIRAIEWSPDGDKIAALDANYNLQVWQVASEELISALRIDVLSSGERWILNVPTSLSWNPNGESVAIGSDYYTSIVDLTTQDVLTSPRGEENYDLIIGVAWSHNGEKIAQLGGFGELKIFDAPEFELLVVSPNTSDWAIDYDKTDSQRLAWNPENTLIANFSEVTDIVPTAEGDIVVIRKVIIVRDALTGEIVTTSEGHDERITSVTWSPDGNKLASTSEDGTIVIWDADTFEQLTSLEGHTAVVSSASWSPDSTFLASGSYDGKVRIWSIP